MKLTDSKCNLLTHNFDMLHSDIHLTDLNNPNSHHISRFPEYSCNNLTGICIVHYIKVCRNINILLNV